jgi:hypothetical protein
MSTIPQSTTPRTDEQVLAYRSEDGSEFVHASFAEELETELAAAIQISTKYENRYFKTLAELSAMKARAEKAEAKIITARSALSRIANSDYRGNRSTESQIAFAALEEIK